MELVEPEVHISFVSVLSFDKLAPSPPTKLSLPILIALTVAAELSTPVSVRTAPSTSVPPVDCLLISTVVKASSVITITFSPV